MAARRKIAIGAAVAAGIYGWWVRPRLLRWAATDEEVAGPYPGSELVPYGKRSPTMAVTIDARPEQVWPWLVQMGWGRGGWYSWDLLDNGGRPSAREIYPEWQGLAVGDQLQYSALGHVADAFRVRVLEPNRFLGMYGYTDLRGRWLDPSQLPRAPQMPAKTESVPVGVTFSTQSFVESAMKRSPAASTATAAGPLSSLAAAGPGVGRPAVPVPATIESVPDGVTSSTTLAEKSAM